MITITFVSVSVLSTNDSSALLSLPFLLVCSTVEILKSFAAYFVAFAE